MRQLPALALTTATLLAASFANGQERAPTVAESIGDGMEVVDPLAFQSTAAAWNTFVVRSAKLALKESSDGEVRRLAAALIDEHANLMAALSIAAQGDELPVAPVEGLDGRQAGMMGKLEASPNGEFDQLFLEMQATAHKEAVGLYSGFAKNGGGQLRAFAVETLPVLQGGLVNITTLATRGNEANPS